MARTSAYNEKYHAPWAWSLAVEGLDMKTIAERMGVSKRTLERWRRDYPAMDEALSQGRDIADSRVQKSLYERAVGYEATETKQTVQIGRDGAPQPVRVETTKKHIPGDVGAQAIWLKNRKGWRDKPPDVPQEGASISKQIAEAWKKRVKAGPGDEA